MQGVCGGVEALMWCGVGLDRRCMPSGPSASQPASQTDADRRAGGRAGGRVRRGGCQGGVCLQSWD